jgi:predicted transposase/invertase (TIGR01784 family)
LSNLQGLNLIFFELFLNIGKVLTHPPAKPSARLAHGAQTSFEAELTPVRRAGRLDFVNNTLHRWLAFFDRQTKVETIEKITSMDTAIRKASERILVVAADKEALRAYHMREMAVMDYTSGINQAKREGRLEGRLEGKLEGIVEIARNMKAAGASMEIIQAYTGLSIDEINRL